MISYLRVAKTIMTLIKAVATKLPTHVYTAVWLVADCDVVVKHENDI